MGELQMKITVLMVLLGLCFFPSQAFSQGKTLTVVYNNVPGGSGFDTGWGFSCMVEGYAKTILFDTGQEGRILLGNLNRARFDPAGIDVLFLSHVHSDHTGGVMDLLGRNGSLEVYCPESFPSSFKEEIKKHSKALYEVREPRQVCEGVWTTGVLGTEIKEQALVLDSERGLVIVTGCAHPGIVRIVRFASEHFHRNVYLLMGGFHLGNIDEKRMQWIVKNLKELGVEKVGPSHCTGQFAMEKLELAWGDGFVHLGCGEGIQLDP